MMNLRSLDLSHNKLSTVPPVIGELLSLEYLSLAHNQISHLPKGKFGIFLTVLSFLCINHFISLSAGYCDKKYVILATKSLLKQNWGA